MSSPCTREKNDTVPQRCNRTCQKVIRDRRNQMDAILDTMPLFGFRDVIYPKVARPRGYKA